MCALYLDLTKAFDTVDHGILLSKLERYGVRGIALDLLKSYLSNRYQFTYINGIQSSLQLIKCGVPQGSILGPLLFLLYINDLPMASDLGITLFADDTCLFYSCKNILELKSMINNEMVKIGNWMSSNRLTINYTKSFYSSPVDLAFDFE